MNEMFYRILQSELWQTPLSIEELDSSEIEEIITEANKQCVAALVCYCLIANGVPLGRKMTLKAMAIVQRVKKDNEKRNFDVSKFSKFLKRRNIPFVIVKGQTVAAFYPHPHLRQSGDIDVFCGQSHFVEAREEIAKKTDLLFDPSIPVKHLSFSIDGSKYELHRILSIFSYPKNQKCFNDLMEKGLERADSVEINGEMIPLLAPTDNVFFQTIHIFYHIIKEGVGLRQFCDLAVYMHANQDRIDFDELDANLNKIGLKDFFQAIVSILVNRLGLSLHTAKIPVTMTKLSKKILEEIDEGGNFGQALEENRHLTILKHYVKYLPDAPVEILTIPYEKLTRRLRGYTS